MSWYYAGPEGKPAGPVTLEELKARQATGTISPETYVIEHTGQPGEAPVWRRYRDIFPPLPALYPAHIAPSAPAHPLFPSAAPVGHHPSHARAPGHPPLHPERKTNPWCLWGLILGVSSLVLLPACGVGIFLALPALFISIVGLVQLQNQREVSGAGFGWGGVLVSGFVLVMAVVLIAVIVPMALKYHDQTATEQSTSDSE